MEQTYEFDLYADNRTFVVFMAVFFGPLMGIELVMAFWLDSLALKCLFIPLCLLVVGLLTAMVRKAKTKLILADNTVSIVSGRKVILPVTDLGDFGAVYVLDLSWRYTGKYRVGDPIGKPVWNRLGYCVFAREELGNEALEALAHRLRRKRSIGPIPEGLAFPTEGQYYPLMRSGFSETGRVFEKKFTLKPGAF